MALDNEMRKAEIAMEMAPATGAGLVFIGRIHTPWPARMETPTAFGGSLVDQLATHGSLSGAIGLAAQVIFAMFPVTQIWRRCGQL